MNQLWYISMAVQKVIQARFFQTAAGNQPLREWLLGLDSANRRIIGGDIMAVELGWPLGPPLVAGLGDGLYEVRSNLTGKRNISRVLFTVQGKSMVLLHGFIKKTRKTPDSDLKLARKRKREFERAEK